MNRSRLLGSFTLVGVALGALACSERRTTTTPSDAPSSIVLGGADGAGGPVPPTSVRVEIRPGVQFQQSMTSTSPGGSTKSATINGMPLEILKTEIRIGSKSYGPIKAGDHVVIDTDGVRINGVLSGPLP